MDREKLAFELFRTDPEVKSIVERVTDGVVWRAREAEATAWRRNERGLRDKWTARALSLELPDPPQWALYHNPETRCYVTGAQWFPDDLGFTYARREDGDYNVNVFGALLTMTYGDWIIVDSCGVATVNNSDFWRQYRKAAQ